MIKGWIVDLEVMKCVLICVTNRNYQRTVGVDLTEGGLNGVFIIIHVQRRECMCSLIVNKKDGFSQWSSNKGPELNENTS